MTATPRNRAPGTIPSPGHRDSVTETDTNISVGFSQAVPLSRTPHHPERQPRTVTAPGAPPPAIRRATTAKESQMTIPIRPARGMLTVREILEDLGDETGKPLARRTWDEWRAKGTGPKCIKLPNGELRIRRAEYDRWLNSREAA